MKFVLILIGLGFALFLFKNMQASKNLTVGSEAPPFNLFDATQKMYALADFQGTWLVLYFYPKDDTPGCTKEACHFRDDSSQFEKLNAKIIGISVDDVASHANFTKKYRLPFPLLSDADGSVAAQYGALINLGPIKFAKRHTYLIDPNGVVAKIYTNVNADQHSQEILNDLKQLNP